MLKVTNTLKCPLYSSIKAIFHKIAEKEFKRKKYFITSRYFLDRLPRIVLKVNESKYGNDKLTIIVKNEDRIYKKCKCGVRMEFKEIIDIDYENLLEGFDFDIFHNKTEKFFKKTVPLLASGCYSQICYKIKRLKE